MNSMRLQRLNSRPHGVARPHGYGLHHDTIIDELLPQPPNGANNNYANSLATIAPIAMAMYCFNKAPQLTMVTLATLLLFIVGVSDE